MFINDQSFSANNMVFGPKQCLIYARDSVNFLYQIFAYKNWIKKEEYFLPKNNDIYIRHNIIMWLLFKSVCMVTSTFCNQKFVYIYISIIHFINMSGRIKQINIHLPQYAVKCNV